MERFKTIENAQDLFKFLSDIPESVRSNLHLDVYDDSEDGSLGEINAEAIQIFEDGCPVSLFRISKVDSE